jgi:hypothetical protein
VSVMNSERSILACMNFDKRSGWDTAFDSAASTSVFSFEDGYRSAIRFWANRATGNVESMRPYAEAARYKGFFKNRRSRTGIWPI